MRYNEIKPNSDLLQNIDLSSYENFNKSLNKISKEQLKSLNDFLEQLRDKIRKPHQGYIELYHGAPQKHAEDIRKNGFKITKGQRSRGLQGLEYTVNVDNQGIFLTDSKQMAYFFGSNRSDYENDWKMFTCYVDETKIISTDKIPLNIKRICLKLFNDYYGSNLKSIPDRDWFWILDKPEIITMIKNLGYNGVKFKESNSIKKLSGSDGHTYLIFDPDSIIIKEKDGMTIKQFYEWLVTNTKNKIQEIYRPQSRQEVDRLLQKNGYTRLGKGVFGAVYEKPNKPYVLKIFSSRDHGYLSFIKLVKSHQNNPHFPKFFGNVFQVTKNYYAIRMEKLTKFKPHEVGDYSYAIFDYIHDGIDDGELINYPDLKMACDLIRKNLLSHYLFDYKDESFMMRGNTIVITDAVLDEYGHEQQKWTPEPMLDEPEIKSTNTKKIQWYDDELLKQLGLKEEIIFNGSKENALKK